MVTSWHDLTTFGAGSVPKKALEQVAWPVTLFVSHLSLAPYWTTWVPETAKVIPSAANVVTLASASWQDLTTPGAGSVPK